MYKALSYAVRYAETNEIWSWLSRYFRSVGKACGESSYHLVGAHMTDTGFYGSTERAANLAGVGRGGGRSEEDSQTRLIPKLNLKKCREDGEGCSGQRKCVGRLEISYLVSL